MPNTKDVQHTTTKTEEIFKEIKELEIQIMAEKDKLNSAENEQRLEDHKKNFLEVRKAALKQSIDFYEINAKKMRNKLAQKSIIHSKFSMAQQCYDKLLETYAANYLQIEPKVESWPYLSKQISVTHILDSEKQTENLQKQIELLSTRINENYFTINNLLESLQFPVE